MSFDEVVKPFYTSEMEAERAQETCPHLQNTTQVQIISSKNPSSFHYSTEVVMREANYSTFV